MIQLSIVYSVAALKVLSGQLLFYLGIFSKGVFLKAVENSLPTPLSMYIQHVRTYIRTHCKYIYHLADNICRINVYNYIFIFMNQ